MRAMSLRLREIVGSASLTSFEMFAAVPARVTSIGGSSAVTVTLSVMAASCSLKSTALSSPRLTTTPFSSLSLNPDSVALTV